MVPAAFFMTTLLGFTFPLLLTQIQGEKRKGFLCVPLPSFSEAVVAFFFQPLLPFYYNAFSLGKKEGVREKKESCDKKEKKTPILNTICCLLSQHNTLQQMCISFLCVPISAKRQLGEFHTLRNVLILRPSITPSFLASATPSSPFSLFAKQERPFLSPFPFFPFPSPSKGIKLCYFLCLESFILPGSHCFLCQII